MFVDPYPLHVFLGATEIMKLLSMSKTTFYEFLKEEGTGFPRPVHMGGKKDRHRWHKSQVYAWIASRPFVDWQASPK